jgi:hypothetical protein
MLMSGSGAAAEAPSGPGEILRVLPKPFTASGPLDVVTDALTKDSIGEARP